MRIMVAAFGSGAMFSLVSGMDGPNLATNGITSGLFLTLVQGGLFKVKLAFRDVRIPPGPRLLILDRNRRSGSYSKAGHTITFGLTWNYSQCQMIFYSVRSFDIVLKLFKLWRQTQENSIFFYSTADAPPPPPLLAVKPSPGRETYGKKMEGVYQKLRNLDAYPKINEDFYCRTLSGGLITLISSTLMLFLFFSELST
ncbi:hypothetical protein OIU76_001123 [Salix suchowensis]|nr:hypothetical protein OIU76_001123 [Salix suchowensis]